MFVPKPVAANLSGPRPWQPVPDLPNPGPDCHPARPTQTRSQAPDPCAPPGHVLLLASSLQLASPIAQLAHGPPAFDLPSIDFPFSLHTPLFFQPSRFTFRFLSITLHYIALPHFDCTTHLGTTQQHGDTPLLKIPKVRSCPVLLCLPSPSLPSSTSILTTSKHPRITTTASHSCLPVVSAPTTLLPLVADRQLSVPIKGSVRRLTNSI